MNDQTITAISTPLGAGGIGIIRISGPSAYSTLANIFIPHKSEQILSKNDSFRLTSHQIYLGTIFDSAKEATIDQVMVVYMQAPRSFTREDVVEIQSHSGYVVLDRILHLAIEGGARMATPGEFTQRAFLNGRIDLSQAEAVIDLINAPCETAVHLASRQLGGEMRTAIASLGEKILGMRADLEATLEFEKSDNVENNDGELGHTLEKEVLPPLLAMIERYNENAVYQNGIKLTIAGTPNVGKSSLLNTISRKETAIVSEVPGTTRDIVREHLSIKGIPVILSDTAGIHDSPDPVECLGIQKTHEQIQQADLIMLVLDGSRELNAKEIELAAQMKQRSYLIVINKKDIVDHDQTARLKSMFPHQEAVLVSAKTGEGIETLKERFVSKIVSGEVPDLQRGATPNLRQKTILDKVVFECRRCMEMIQQNENPDFVSQQLKDMYTLLGEITGQQTNEDLYDQIFKRFCIGK